MIERTMDFLLSDLISLLCLLLHARACKHKNLTGIVQKPTSATFTLRIKTLQNLARRYRHPERAMVRRGRRI